VKDKGLIIRLKERAGTAENQTVEVKDMGVSENE